MKRVCGITLPAISLLVLSSCGTLDMSKRVLPTDRCYVANVFDASDERREHPIEGIEDITIDARTNIAYLSAFPRRAETDAKTFQEKLGIRGGIYGLQLNQIESPRDVDTSRPVRLDATNLTGDLAEELDLRPHGISLYAGAPGESAGQRSLFVISHRLRQTGGGPFTQGKMHVIEAFALSMDGLGLTHRSTIRHEDDGGAAGGASLCSPNDLAALDHERFLITNSFGSCSPLGQILEAAAGLFGFGWSNVLYYDGENFNKVADGFLSANGIAVVPGQKDNGEGMVFVATSGERALYQYPLEKMLAAGDVVGYQTKASIKSALDNIEVHPDRRTLYIGSHPSRVRFALHAIAPSIFPTSPSEVVRVEIGDGTAQGGKRSLHVQRFYYFDDGTELSASSVAAVTNDLMLIGSVFSNRIVVCDLSDSKEQALY